MLLRKYILISVIFNNLHYLLYKVTIGLDHFLFSPLLQVAEIFKNYPLCFMCLTLFKMSKLAMIGELCYLIRLHLDVSVGG